MQLSCLCSFLHILATFVTLDPHSCPLKIVYWALPGLTLFVMEPEKSQKAISYGNYRTSAIYFPSLRDHCLSLPDVQCLANHCFIYFVCFIVFQEGGQIQYLLINLVQK